MILRDFFTADYHTFRRFSFLNLRSVLLRRFESEWRMPECGMTSLRHFGAGQSVAVVGLTEAFRLFRASEVIA